MCLISALKGKTKEEKEEHIRKVVAFMQNHIRTTQGREPELKEVLPLI